MSHDDFRAPAGWYPDPLGHPQLRWWNSQGWTEQVSSAPTAPPVQQPYVQQPPPRVSEQRFDGQAYGEQAHQQSYQAQGFQAQAFPQQAYQEQVFEPRVQEQPRAQEPRYAWKEDEPVVPQQSTPFRAPTPPPAPVSATLHELEAPRAQNKVDETSPFADWQPSSANAAAAPQVTPPPVPVAQAAPVSQQSFAISAPAAAPAAAAEPAAPTPAPPAYWDEDDDSRPEPSVRPEDLKFWPGTSPAELRRLAREQAARDNQA